MLLISRVAPVAGAAVTPGEDDDQQQRELDLLLRTPASLAGAIRQIETQVRSRGLWLAYRDVR